MSKFNSKKGYREFNLEKYGLFWAKSSRLQRPRVGLNHQPFG